MRLTKITNNGVDKIRRPAILWLFCCLPLVAFFNAAQAVNPYYDDGTVNDLFSQVFSNDDPMDPQANGYGCLGCHGGGTAACSVGTGDSPGATLYADSYAGVAACADRIAFKTGLSVPDTLNNERMPQGGPYLTTGGGSEHEAVSIWASNGAPLAPPDASGLFEDLITNVSARVNATIDTNVWSGTGVDGTYTIEYGPTTAYGQVLASGTRNATTATSFSINTNTVEQLECGTTYYTRAIATNGQSPNLNSDSATGTFTTLACSNPVINFTGAGSAPGTPIGVAKNGSFTQADLSLPVTEPDSAITWSFTPPASGSISGFNAGNGNFTYNAPAAVGTTSFTLTVTDNDPFTPLGAAGPNSATVTVYVQIVDNPPQFKDAPAGSVITSDNMSVNEDSSQLITMFAEDIDGDTLTWSIAPGGNPSRGSLGSFSTATGTTNSITYTPGNNNDLDDSFVVRVNDGAANVDLTVNVDVMPMPDNPTAGNDGPFIFDVDVPVLVTVLTNDGDVDTGDSISINPASLVSGTGATLAVVGNQIRYTPPPGRTTADSFQYGVIDSTMRTSNQATVSMSPRDTDGDGVIDYLDNCAATPNPSQLDTDNDQVINVNTTMDPGGDVGGNACDSDDDGDMISDIDELNNSLDPLDPADALLDNDGDGINNRDEINNGTNPNSENLIIDATGYFTPFDLPTPDPKDYHPAATVLTASDYGPYRPGDNSIYWTPSNSQVDDLSMGMFADDLVTDPPVQAFYVRPLLNFAADQIAAEGTTVSVMLSINGDAPNYPVAVNYSISGSATPADYTTPMPVSGSVIFNDTTPQTISFDLAQGDGADAGETIVFRITSASNAAIGSRRRHTVTIIEENVAPQARLRFSQGGNPFSSAVAGAGVDVEVIVDDVNVNAVVPGVTHTYNWSDTDNSLVAFAGGNSWTTPVLGAGNYPIEVVVRDNGSPKKSVRVRRILNVVAVAPTLLNTNDADGDGDDDLLEGFDDSDEDGIPDYLDALDGGAGAANLLDDQTASLARRYWLETETGLSLRIGSTAQAAASYGALITDAEIEDHGSARGGAVRNADDDFDHFVGVYDFTVSGMQPGSSALVVVPLQVGIPRDAEFRKFDHLSGWGAFVEDASNRLYSVRGELGACPEPGSALYRRGLNYLDNCLQMLVEDGGPNDNDHMVNGEYADPGTLGARLTEPVQFEEVEDGGGQMSLLLMTLLALLGLKPVLRRRLAIRR